MFVREKLSLLLPRLKRAGKVWRFRCPVCGDSRSNKNLQRGNYYLDTDSFHCFRCQATRSGMGLISELTHQSFREVQSEFLLGLRNGFGGAIDDNTTTDNILPTIDLSSKRDEPIEINKNWGDIPTDVNRIIKERGIYDAPFYPKNWRLYYDARFNKIIIPWTRDGEIKCHQFMRIDPNEDCPKYMFGKDQDKDVFNLKQIDFDADYVFLVEGVYDTIFVKNGVAIGGLNPSEEQLELISLQTLGVPVYLPDNQHTDAASKRFTNKLIDDGKLVFIWPKYITEKDVNEYVMKTNNHDFENVEWLKSRIFRGIRAKLELGL